MTLRVARVLHGTEAEGPGRRTAVWVQGCSIRCPGCINAHLFPAEGGTPVDPADVVAAAVASGDEGVTLLGGEPFDQPEAGRELCDAAHAAGLGVICFTGFVVEDLQRDPVTRALVAAVDLLVDGPYVASEADTERALVGSSNQRFVHVTDRYADYDPVTAKDRLELRLHPDGTVDTAGFLTRAELVRVTEATATRRVDRRCDGR